ncbi:bifunctional tetrahydrofolate synthase/dihydrofolate synthase [Conchiformibius steedae DSM 2580]|uniref:Dihydrofolate synthase/folylpolyglutamate synthase n=1 Tax=Conchiformibius steedae DSM 2580 TaxID=1121352 RepID=A0AAE9HT48_9NEIS|nr:bifunctional tetrahydrofolate synthase/dihydrofolate synthase [Conchiformibius steedae]QMT32997.1 bifunctional tetrahydrofolate synthase/dihydrofolate synthase [Conchiformibius steedae]URD67619.1 bifunctional tetrahydrofolate synthase/dihydrofolate synthase [Conchiformibius steedae DSM 2580]
MTRPNTLEQWLAHLETAHSKGLIDMGLERIAQVRDAMHLHPHCPVIAVAGTNGKGSVCAFLSKIYREAGYKTGTLTSPHLLRFNERIAVNCRPVSDSTIVAAFERIEAARGDVSLTYFEFNTLAAVDIFIREQVDVMILEVGLGGRLDAVNVFDADCAVVTAVDLDHQAYLGDNIEDIAFEKAGIFRTGKPAVCGHTPPPARLKAHARDIGAQLILAKQDFDHSVLDSLQWSFRFAPAGTGLAPRKRHALPTPALRGSCQIRNAACALAAVECLNERLPVDIGAIKRGLLTAENPGRFQVLPGRPLVVLDVAHNPHAARALRQNLIALPYAARRIAVFAMLADKDIDTVLDILKDQFDEWYIAPLNVPRAIGLPELVAKMNAQGIICHTSFPDIATACRAALSGAAENDRIVVFGSFHTVAEAAAVCH